MRFRTDSEVFEDSSLSPYAMRSSESRGRVYDEDKCSYRTEYQRDRDRIIHSKAFRRLMHKTQVFLAPEDDHYRTRLTHTIEVSQISRTIARILNLNEDLAEAIALGHDLGHTPFGHAGESVLNQIHKGGFKHNEQSLRTVDKLEVTSRRVGLNLTYEVRDGILNHRGDGTPCTLEGQVVKFSDRIAYINHDIDDALRSGIIEQKDLPRQDIEILGETHSDRINNLIVNLTANSDNSPEIKLSKEYYDALMDLRGFMFTYVYRSDEVLAATNMNKVDVVIRALYEYYLDNADLMPELYRNVAKEDGIAVAVKDYISGMTDRYAINKYKELFVPRSW
ncbi:MAG: deoxyguanosinetriphosphate triphosphohydrolase [Anaerovoracaceae bacterium]